MAAPRHVGLEKASTRPRRGPVSGLVQQLLRARRGGAVMQATIEFSVEFEREVSLHQGLLLGAAMRFTRSRPEAEDLVQETVFRAWRFWGTFETGTHRRAWLLRILRNTFINRHRRTRREREVLAEVRQAPWSAEGWCSEPSESLREGAMGDQVTAALEALPDAFRRVLVLVDLDVWIRIGSALRVEDQGVADDVRL